MTISLSSDLNKRLAEFSKLNSLEYDPEFLIHLEEACIGLTIEKSYAPFYMEIREYLADTRITKGGKVIIWEPKKVDLLWASYLRFLYKEEPSFLPKYSIPADTLFAVVKFVQVGVEQPR
ncbi:MAG: hypothetical protein HY291_04505 [Planctomycetes bacterium]|nr:hypothetical protein [Planctomycetota bacterium]